MPLSLKVLCTCTHDICKQWLSERSVFSFSVYWIILVVWLQFLFFRTVKRNLEKKHKTIGQDEMTSDLRFVLTALYCFSEKEEIHRLITSKILIVTFFPFQKLSICTSITSVNSLLTWHRLCVGSHIPDMQIGNVRQAETGSATRGHLTPGGQQHTTPLQFDPVCVSPRHHYPTRRRESKSAAGHGGRPTGQPAPSSCRPPPGR